MVPSVSAPRVRSPPERVGPRARLHSCAIALKFDPQNPDSVARWHFINNEKRRYILKHMKHEEKSSNQILGYQTVLAKVRKSTAVQFVMISF